MDWLNIVLPIVTALIPAGGLTGIFLFKGKKKELEISNLQSVIKLVQEEREEKKLEAAELRAALRKKEDYIETLQKEKSVLYSKLDKATSRVAVLSILRCKAIDCVRREPPFGSEASQVIRDLYDKENQKEDEK